MNSTIPEGEGPVPEVGGPVDPPPPPPPHAASVARRNSIEILVNPSLLFTNFLFQEAGRVRLIRCGRQILA
jgi:hypothetical protein